MKASWRYIVVAVVFLATGVAAGLALAPRASDPRGPEASESRPAAGPAVERSRTPERTAQAKEKLSLAAAALSQIPNLRPEQTPPSHVHVERQRVQRKDLPLAVEAVVQQVTKDKLVHDLQLERRQQGGQPVYSLDVDLDGVETELVIDEQGKVLESERNISPSDLPTGVASAIQTALPGAVMLEAEHKTKEDASFYEVELRLDRHRHELYVGEDGKILRHRTR